MNVKDSSILERIREGHGLPVLSPVAIRLIELASSETSSGQDLADLMAKDPSLAIRVLKLANAAFYRNAGQITTIEHAIMRIGFARLRTMALAISLRDTFPMGKVGPMDYEEFWRASMYRAIIAKGLARTSGNCNPEEAFVAGLTLEVGLLIFFDLFVKNKLDSMPGQYPLETLLAWEQAQFGIDHREIGREALRCWNFPEIMVECQKVPLDDKRPDSVQPLALLCDASRKFSCLISEKTTGWYAIFSEIEAIYGIKSSTLTPLLVSAFDEVQQIAESLTVKMSRERDLIELLGKANDTLQKLTLTMAKWIFFVLDGKGGERLGATSPIDQYALTDRLQMVAGEIRKPLEIIREFIDNLAPAISPASAEWAHVQSATEEVKKVELAVMLLK